ncbi:MAG: putative oxygenase MesX, partial [Enterobacteriaceae bacterium]
MNTDFTFTIKSSRFDENYNPSENTRITTNFANLARGDNRQENLRNTLVMMNNRFNTLAHWDNPKGDRYSIELDIISVEMNLGPNGESFPAIEVLRTWILDHKTHERTEGIVGNNFSSYVRDYDFSVVLLDHNKDKPGFSIPDNFGDLHGNIFKHFIHSDAYKAHFKKAPVICLSVSSKDIYHRTGNEHPVLGHEYAQNGVSLTEQYFNKM